MSNYLMIQNPGVAPPEAFTLLGASTKRGNTNSATIGKFGSGNKYGVTVALRHNLPPIVFAGNLRMEFGTRAQNMDDGLSSHEFKRVVVKYGGTDANGTNRSSFEDLGFVLEYGATDWLDIDLALREFISNSLDRATEEHAVNYFKQYWADHNEPNKEDALVAYRASNPKPWKDVTVQIVDENQVRAKRGFTRVFVPMNEKVFAFSQNLGKWFLHFSEPHLLNEAILPKANRNLGNRKAAVIYRRGVCVREFETSDVPSLYDYNLESLQLDESRRVDDWNVQWHSAATLGKANIDKLVRVWQSIFDGEAFWEHSFTHGLDHNLNASNWNEAFLKVVGENGVVSLKGSSTQEQVKRKGYNVVSAPESYLKIAEQSGIKTPYKVLSLDELSGLSLFESTPDVDLAVKTIWGELEKHSLTNGKEYPGAKTFVKIMNAGSQELGFYRPGENMIYINQDISVGQSHQLLMTVMEELGHYVTQSLDNSRDFQDFFINFCVKLLK